ncbi:T9SS type A sorting domain-containing protein [Winogradskyella thalassocola]|uniref:Por secretion system C-terminal sorting domain-containing protein n=1 Tax=Winogradskyella thalassocola TaxID=262004 RepID=A0A1G8B3N4_9FLAO|nr:T9SS type A sorting domain-containing protein [Winogradskyella thalassocola]SDH27745.1 Por secretion system C-terminal sorting domain-containing protein [Winogradskyella thalassocola]
MKHFFLTSFLLFCFLDLFSQNVTFEDPNFKNYLLSSICADLNNDGYPESVVDINNDGEIQISEAEAVFMLEINENCLATSAEGIAAFTNLNEILLENTNLTTIDLSFISQISELEISSNPNLTSISLGQLTSVTRHITFDLNPNLESIDLSNLITVGGRFVYRYNATTSNTTINLDLSSLTSIGSNLFITDNDSVLPMTIDLSNLVTVNQSMIINDNNILDIDLSNLTYIHGFRFRGNDTVTDLNLSNVVSNEMYITSSDEISIYSTSLETINFSSLEYSVERILIYNPGNIMDVNLSSFNNLSDGMNLNYDSPIISLPSFQNGSVSISGDVQQIELESLETGGVSVYTTNDDLNSINLNSLTDGGVYLNNNQLTELNLPNLVTASNLDVNYNSLTSINVPLLETIENFNLVENQLDNFELSNVTVSGTLNLSGNPLTNLNLHNNTIDRLSISNTGFSILDLSSSAVSRFSITNNLNLLYINIKNGHIMEPSIYSNAITLVNVPNLTYMCADADEIDFVTNLIPQSCNINTYCSFVPGGEFFVVEGENKFDSNSDGCDATDPIYPNLMYSISDGTVEGISISNINGSYSIPLEVGNYTITPNLLNDDYFSISPENISVNFPDESSPYTQDFCITPNGIKNDLQVYIIPLSAARPGFDSTYKIIYKNVGNTTLSGNVTLTFDDDLMDFVTSMPAITTNLSSVLTWEYTNLEPFENSSILVTMNLNTPTHPTFPLNNSDYISFQAIANPIADDETAVNNIMSLKQLVVNSFDPNDITCLEGPQIIESEVGRDVHYKIRFENTGSASAINIVVKTIIDETKFDITSLAPLDSSHSYITKIANSNEVEFIFENIELPFDDENNDGYVVFKIKTLPTLALGDTFESKADIFFDYNFPIITNTYSTEIVSERLNIDDVNRNDIQIYPNPVKDILRIKGTSSIQSISMYTLSGQLLLEQRENTNELDLSPLKDGIYILNLKTHFGEINKQIIK